MKDVSLTFVNFQYQGFRSSYMSAFGSEQFEPGELTSDYLGFFGFGTGRNEAKGCPDELKGFINFEFPSLDDSTIDQLDLILMHYNRLNDIVKYYESIGIILDINDITQFVSILFKSLNIPHQNAFMATLIEKYKEPLGYRTIMPALVTLIVRDGHRYLALGGPILSNEEAGDNIGTDFPIWETCQMPGFNWDYYTQLGDYTHTRGILKTMSRHAFVTDWQKCKHTLKQTISAVDKLYLAI